MEEKALETIRAILDRRGLTTNTTQTGEHEYTVGDHLVIFLTGDNSPTMSAIDKIIKGYEGRNIIIVSAVPISESTRANMRTHILESKPVQMFYLLDLQFNKMTHEKYWFPCRILKNDEKNVLAASLRISSLRQLPKVAYDDPVPLWLGAKPDDVVEYDIPSESAGWSKKYRHVVINVEDV
jgi:DNA-directed RNA polymerase subunit H (RpoH/RPB5)